LYNQITSIPCSSFPTINRNCSYAQSTVKTINSTIASPTQNPTIAMKAWRQLRE
jgi:hypothetical protein